MSALFRTAPFLVLSAILMASEIPTLTKLKSMIARFTPAPLKVDTASLSSGDKRALLKLIQAGRVVNDIFMDQIWSANAATYSKLQRDASSLGRERMHYYWLEKSPWSSLDGHAAFLPGVPPKKPAGANFYPEDMTRQEFEAWVKTLPKASREQAENFFSVIRRDAGGKLTAVPYSTEYGANLQKAAGLLRDAAAATENESLKKFLSLRADAFLSGDYYASDLAWMDLDAPLDITIGPYETYNDELFGYKAAFEAYITLRDDAETAKLKFFGDHLQEVENNLPIDPKYRNPKLGALSPIRVVNEILSSGDAAHGVRTAAFNLPNDERVVREKGSKRVMLKNVQEAKFNLILTPIAKRVLSRDAQANLSFDAFFTHILAHELTHGIGPHQLTIGGRASTPRQELKELYSTIEEAKADVCGLFMLQYLMDKGLLRNSSLTEQKLYTTFLASSFRTLRFGLNEAHGKGMAIQVAYLLDKGAIRAGSGGAFEVDYAKMKGAVSDLAHELLTVEATGDYPAAKTMLERAMKLPPAFETAISNLADLPTDIEPEYVTATALARAGAAAPAKTGVSRKKSVSKKR
jgi:hypothetical protein